MRRPPRLGQSEGQPLRDEGEDAQDAARRLVGGVRESYLAIQGPPGSGKSTVGAEMIGDSGLPPERLPTHSSADIAACTNTSGLFLGLDSADEAWQ